MYIIACFSGEIKGRTAILRGFHAAPFLRNSGFPCPKKQPAPSYSVSRGCWLSNQYYSNIVLKVFDGYSSMSRSCPCLVDDCANCTSYPQILPKQSLLFILEHFRLLGLICAHCGCCTISRHCDFACQVCQCLCNLVHVVHLLVCRHVQCPFLHRSALSFQNFPQSLLLLYHI